MVAFKKKEQELPPKSEPIPIVRAGIAFAPVANSTYEEMMAFAGNAAESRAPVYRAHIERLKEDPELIEFLKLAPTFIRLADKPEEGKLPWFAYYDGRTGKILIRNDFGPASGDIAKWTAYINANPLTPE